MASRFVLALVAAFLLFQMTVWLTDATVIRRDTGAATKNASQTLEEALQSFRTGFDDLVKNIQGNELLQNVSQSLKAFGEQVQNRSQQLVSDIQKATQPKN